MPSPHVSLFVDANSTIGYGHLARCRTLGKHLRNVGFDLSFVSAKTPDKVLEDLEHEGFDTRRLNQWQPREVFDALPDANTDNAWGLADLSEDLFYRTAFQRRLRERLDGLAMITFKRSGEFNTDILLNPNPLALDGSNYKLPEGVQSLLGPDYMVLRPEFAQRRQPLDSQAITSPETLLITFGGSDPASQTVESLRSIRTQGLDSIETLIVVVGALNNDECEIRNLLDELAASHAIELHVDTSEMPTLMERSDIALTSTGLTWFELACLAVPTLVITASGREKTTAEWLDRHDYCKFLGHAGTFPREVIAGTIEELTGAGDRLVEFARRSHQLIDGHGAPRIAGVLEEALS